MVASYHKGVVVQQHWFENRKSSTLNHTPIVYNRHQGCKEKGYFHIIINHTQDCICLGNLDLRY